MKLLVAIAALTFVNAVSLGAAVLVTLAPQARTIQPGGSTAVQVRVSGFGLDAAPSLGAFDFNLAFDPAVVLLQGLTFGDPVLGDQLNLSGLGSLDDFSLQAPGLLEFYELSLDSAAVLDAQQPGQFVLATLQFQGIAKGSTLLVPSLNSISDSQGAPLTVGFQTGSINVVPASVPEPNGFWSVSLAAAAALLTRRKSRKSRT